MELSAGAENGTGLYHVTNSSLKTSFFFATSVQVEPNLWLQSFTENYFRTSQYEAETLSVEEGLREEKYLEHTLEGVRVGFSSSRALFSFSPPPPPRPLGEAYACC